MNMQEPPHAYWQHVRREIEPLLRREPARILEIGCGGGRTLAWLKHRWPKAETVGIDGFAEILPELERNADKALIADLDKPLPADLGKFDLILALDVLEHLKNADAVIQSLSERLAPGGNVIVSVPNVAHLSVILDLVLRRTFEYRDAGILDRTHLRFFTESSAVGMMNDAGLRVTAGVVNGWDGKRSRRFNRLTAGLFRHYFVKQYIMLGEAGTNQKPVDWKRSEC